MKGAKFKIWVFLLVVCFSSTDCRQTKIFRKLRLKGRVVNYITGAPISNVPVALKANDVHSSSSYSEASVSLGSAITNSNGEFLIESNVSKGSIHYIVLGNNFDRFSKYDCVFKTEGGDENIGDIKYGKYTFNYKLHIVSNSNYCGSYSPNANYYDQVELRNGIDTIVNYQLKDFDYDVFKHDNSKVPFQLRRFNCSTNIEASNLILWFDPSNVDPLIQEVSF